LVGTAKATLPISGVTSIDASDTTSTAGAELNTKINTAIVSIATANPSAFFRIKSVKAVHK
jgi:hypothetical protein